MYANHIYATHENSLNVAARCRAAEMSEVYNQFTSLSLPLFVSHSFLTLVHYWIFLFVYQPRLWSLDNKTVNESTVWVTNRLTQVPDASGEPLGS